MTPPEQPKPASLAAHEDGQRNPEREERDIVPEDIVARLSPDERRGYEKHRKDLEEMGEKIDTHIGLYRLRDRITGKPGSQPALSPEDAEKMRTAYGGMMSIFLRNLANRKRDWGAFEGDDDGSKIRELEKRDEELGAIANEAIEALRTENVFRLDRSHLIALDNARRTHQQALKDSRIRGTETEQSLREQLQTVNLIKALDPRRAAEWDAVNNRKGSIAGKALRAGVGVAALAPFVMSLIILIRNRKNPGPMDAPLTALWGGIAAVALGFISLRERSAFEPVMQTTARFMGESYRPVRELVRNTIGVENAVAATRELHDALANNVTEQNALKKALRKKAVTEDFAEEHFGRESKLYNVLMEKCVNPEQRINFLGTLLRENVQDPGGRDALVKIWENLNQFG